MKTVIKEYDDDGHLIKETTIEETPDTQFVPSVVKIPHCPCVRANGSGICNCYKPTRGLISPLNVSTGATFTDQWADTVERMYANTLV